MWGGNVQKGLPHLVIAKSSLSQTILKMIPKPYIYFGGWEGRMRVFCVLIIFEGRPISPCRGLRNPRRDRCWFSLVWRDAGAKGQGGEGNEQLETTRIFACTNGDWGRERKRRS